MLSVSSSCSLSLQIVYDNSPREHYRNAGGEPSREQQILGGEAAMWTEQVTRKWKENDNDVELRWMVLQ